MAHKLYRLCALVAVVLGGGLLLLWAFSPYLRGLVVRTELAGPFFLEFGRGSGMHGLDTIKVMQDGSVILHRQDIHGWETTTIQLPESGLLALREAVNKHRLRDLKRQYSDPTIADGTQWVLRIRDINAEEATYFNNSFPEEIKAFAEELDGILGEHGIEEVKWRPVHYLREREHEKALWNSIR